MVNLWHCPLLQLDRFIAACESEDEGKKKQHPLFDLFLHGSHPLSLRVLKPVGGATKVAQNIMTLVMQEDVLHL